jgi:hypothetical protein
MKNKYIKEFKKIWKDSYFTLIFLVSLITYLLIEFNILK